MGSVADRELLTRIDRMLDRIDEHMARGNEHVARGNELMEQIREEHRLNREEHRLNREEHRRNRAAIQNVNAVLRELVLEVRDQRGVLQRIEHGIQAQTEGLLHVLDELRGRGSGPSSAEA
jgi:uncharacterized coiled-coil DUF342 family protein